MDCCGNDIILCRDATLDLSCCCIPPSNPCNNRTPAPQQPPGDETVSFGPLQLPKSQVQAVDIMVRYSETQSDPRTGLARGGCSGSTACEYTRTQESYQLYCTVANGCDDPSTKLTDDWFNGYTDGLNRLLETLGTFVPGDDARKSLGRLILWLKQHPPQVFCFIGEQLCDLQRMDELPEHWFDDIVFWIIQDWRNEYFRCACAGCGPDTGVRLARVWLWRRKDNQQKDRCSVVYINAYPPFRRPVIRDCWPVPSDAVTLAPYIWQTVDSSKGPIQQLGFSDVTFTELNYATFADLKRQLADEMLYVFWNDRYPGNLTAYFYEDHCGDSRIVLFRLDEKALPRPPMEPGNLREDAPELDLRKVPGIGDGIAKRLQAGGIKNLDQLSNAPTEKVMNALSTMPIMRPDEARITKFIDDAKAELAKLKKGE
jgi:hypothetical protein